MLFFTKNIYWIFQKKLNKNIFPENICWITNVLIKVWMRYINWMLLMYRHSSICRGVICSRYLFISYDFTGINSILLLRMILRANTRFTRTRRVERCSRSVTKSRRSESPCLLVSKKKKGKDGDPPLPSNRYELLRSRTVKLLVTQSVCKERLTKKHADFRVMLDRHFSITETDLLWNSMTDVSKIKFWCVSKFLSPHLIPLWPNGPRHSRGWVLGPSDD